MTKEERDVGGRHTVGRGEGSRADVGNTSSKLTILHEISKKRGKSGFTEKRKQV